MVSENLKETRHLNELNTWGRDTVMWYWSADTLFWQPKFSGCIDNEILLPMVLCYQLTLNGFKNVNQHFFYRFGVNRYRSTTLYRWPLCARMTAHIILRQRWVIRACFFVHSIAFCVKRLDNVCFTFLFYSSVIWTNYCLSMERGVISVSQSSSCTLSTRTSAFMLLRWVGE